MSHCVGDRLVCRSGRNCSSFPTCTLDGHLHSVTYTRSCIDTINSPDDEHCAARYMHRIEITCKKKNCASGWLFTRRRTILLDFTSNTSFHVGKSANRQSSRPPPPYLLNSAAAPVGASPVSSFPVSVPPSINADTQHEIPKGANLIHCHSMPYLSQNSYHCCIHLFTN